VAAHAGEVAQTLRLIARLAHQVTPGDLALVNDGVQRALVELGESYGFVRLAAAARDTRLDERAVT
jgi:hypothetical protein